MLIKAYLATFGLSGTYTTTKQTYLDLRERDGGLGGGPHVDGVAGPVEVLLLAEVTLHEHEVAGVGVGRLPEAASVGPAVHVQQLQDVVLTVADRA